MGATELWLIGLDTLDAVRDTYAVHGEDLPSRQYVSVGPPPDDCDQLVVWLGRLYTGTPGEEVDSPELCGFARTLEVNVRASRCVPVVGDDGTPPHPDTIEGAALIIAKDQWLIPQGLIERRGEGSFLSDCQDLSIGNCVPFEWSGGIGGCELLIRVQVDRDLN